MTMEIRGAVEDDYPSFVRLFGELSIPDPTPPRDRYVAQIVSRMLVAREGDLVIGYAIWRAYGTTAHVPNVVVDPAWRGRRVGQRLLERVRELACAAGCTRWYLNVKADNAAAIRLYERCGFALDQESWALSIRWAAALGIPFDPELATSLVRPEDDAELSERFGMAPERIAAFRTRATGSVLVAVHAPEGGGPVAFAAFNPHHPGAHPFVVRRADLAGNLLRACHGYADLESFDFIRLTVEGDRPLYDSLIASGATLTFALLQLASPL
ncbi:MAG: GNAT family N-acetyltransferase [Kofleriaceae bacterium]